MSRNSLVLSFVLSAVLAACGGNNSGTGGDGGGGGVDAGSLDDGGFPCVNLQCRQVTCAGGGTTSVSGVVSTPAGNLPLYNVIVYVPNAPVDPFVPGVSCDRCDSLLSGSPLVQTTTDTAGRFKLDDMPAGTGIPLVVQIGKWRRQIVIPEVGQCVDTALDAAQVRLPRNKGEGDIPKIALTTGGADAIECMLRKVGIDDAEFTTEAGEGRVNLFNGQGGASTFSAALGGATFTSAPTFWGNLASMKQYDIVLHSCEGTENPSNKSAADTQVFEDYTDVGGRVFASHWHNYWIEHGSDPLPTAGVFNHQSDLSNPGQPPFVADIDTTFPKGAALAEWLLNVGGSTTLGKISLIAAQHTLTSVNALVGAQRFVFSDTPAAVLYFALNTPMTAAPEAQCGRVVLSDIHVSAGDRSTNPFPSGCTTTDLTAEEKALIFMLFDLSSCITPDIP